MSNIKILIKNSSIVNYDNIFKGDILLQDGIIEEVAENIKCTEAEVINAEGKYVFPGFIDAHTHPGLPEDLGYSKKTNDFYTETKAALIGGTTTIFDFAEQAKGERLIDALNKRKNRYKGKEGCKFWFHVAVTEVTEDIFDQLAEIKREGINSIKIYTTYGMKLNNDDILKIMECCAKLDMTVLVHCENDSIVKYCSLKDSYGDTRPAEAETVMVYTIINFAALTKCRVYICHVSSKNSVEIIAKAKGEGLRVYLETCPQYLTFDDSKYSLDDREMTKFILSPPFRKKEDNEALKNACLDGTVDLISTDHCSFLFEEHKAKFSKDINKAAKGMPGLQLRSSLVYTYLVKEMGMSLQKFVELMSYNPAKILGINDRGYIKKGMAGDIVIWAEEKFTVTMEKIFEGTDYSPYEGLVLTGKAIRTIIS